MKQLHNQVKQLRRRIGLALDRWLRFHIRRNHQMLARIPMTIISVKKSLKHRSQLWTANLDFGNKVSNHVMIQEIKNSERSFVALPGIDGKPGNCLPILIPPMTVRIYRRALCNPYSSFIGYGSHFPRAASWTPEDGVFGPKEFKSRLNGGIARLHFQNRVVLESRGISSSVGKAVFVGGLGSSNWYHWMVEIAPKLSLLDDLPERLRSAPLIVPAEACSGNFYEAIRCFAPGRELMHCGLQELIQVDELAVFDAISWTPFNLQDGEKVAPQDHRFRASLLQSYSKKLANFCNSSGQADYSFSSKAADRVFLRRGGGRRIYNQQEVEDLLVSMDFMPVDFEDLCLSDQIATMRNAKLLVGPSGAAWANLIFSRPGARALLWLPEELSESAIFSSLAWHFDVEIAYHLYRASGEFDSHSYSIDIVKLADDVNSLISDD